MFSNKNLCALLTISLSSFSVAADRYYPPSETSIVEAENQYTAKSYALKLGPEKLVGDMYLSKVILQGEKPLLFVNQRLGTLYIYSLKEIPF